MSLISRYLECILRLKDNLKLVPHVERAGKYKEDVVNNIKDD